MGAAMVFGQQGVADPVFDLIPFEQWLKGGGEARFRWSMRILPPVLTAHQRLSVVVSVQVDGEELLKRKGPGRVVIFLEIRDREGRVFRSHRALRLSEVKPASLAAVHCDYRAFVTPGDYQVVAAIYDSESQEHSFKRMTMHVPPIARDPLTESWRGLPEVEFTTLPDGPDRWYLPQIASRLHLPVATERRVRVEVVVNESPTELAARGTGRVSRRNMGNLIPALKVIAQLELRNGSMNVTLLDLERRKVSFEQEDVRSLDWTRLRAALTDNDPNQIDVRALAHREQNAQFFVSEIRKRLEGTESNGDVPLGLTAEPARVLIVLSGPMAFPKGQDLRPIEAAPEPGSRVFYVRYYPPVGPGRGAAPPGALTGRGSLGEDSLLRTLKPLAPRLFNVTTPMEFRSAVAAIMSEISQLK